ncbi:MAG: hypothetical protein J1F18_03070 [Lachnospiraceae bacterium]|nr:hypothetical protein [Lachnospiraceae bacterium]
MKYHVSITKREIFTAILLMIGFILLFRGIHASYKIHHALNLEDLNERTLKEGDYVAGNIDTYIGQIVYGSNNFSGVSQILITSGRAYNFYTVPTGQNSYICIMAYGESLLSQLKAFENGHGEKIYFEGIVVEPATDINYNWYALVEGFDTNDLIDSFVIKEAHFDGNIYVIYIGVLLLVTAALMFFSAGGLKNFVMEDVENTGSVYRNYAKIYNKDNELQAEKMQLETLERRLNSAKRSAVLCLVLLLVGIYIVYSAYLLEGKLFGVLLILIAVRGIWNYFINSDNALAQSLVRRFSLKSISIQIDEHKQNIEKLEEKG